MIDQLHAFPDAEAANAAFPLPLDDEGNPINAPCWLHDGATILPLTVYTMVEGAVVPSGETWIGLSCKPADADTWWALPSARVELVRPAREPEFWLDQVTRSNLPPEAATTVMGASPQFGLGYTFPAWPEVDPE
jgi:hypothetical protein